MSDRDISISFSAQIGQLISGVDQVKNAISSIASPVNALASVFTGFGSAFAAAFAVDQVADFVSQMEDLGTKTLRTSAMLGVSTTEAQQLGFIAKATGGDADDLALSMERLQVNLQKAQSGAGPAAQALQALGLSAKSLIGLPLDQQLNKIADAVSKYADGGNKTAIVIDLLGRSGAQMIPVLDQGSAGLEKLRQSADAAGAIVSRQTVAALDKAGTAAMTMRSSVTALGESIVGALAPAIVSASSGLASLASGMSALIETGNFAKAVMDELSTSLHIVATNFANVGLVINDMLSMHWIQAGKDWLAGNEEIRKIQQQADAKLIAQATQAHAELQKINAAPPVDTAKPQAPAMAVPNKDALNASIEQYQTMVKAADDGYAQMKQLYTADGAAHRITTDQETQDLLTALNFRHEAEDAVYAAALQAAQNDAVKYAEIQKQKLAADDKWKLEHNEIVAEALKKDTAEWQSVLSPIESAWNSQLRGLLAGTTTWSQAMKKIIGDVVISAIEGFEKIALEKAASGLANLVGGPASALGSLFGGGGQSASTTANTTALGTLTTAVSALNVTLGGHAIATTANTAGTAANTGVTGANTISTAADAASTDASTGATLAQTISTDAQTIATWALEAITAVKAVFGFAQGAWSIPHDMVAQVHQGEMIVPKEGGHADAMRAALSNGLAGLTQRAFKFDEGTNYVLNSGFAMIHQGEAIVPARGSGPYEYDGAGGGGGTDGRSIARHIARALAPIHENIARVMQSSVRAHANVADELRHLRRRI